MPSTTVLKGDGVGGFLDKLINKGQLPEVNVTLSKETLIGLALMIIVAAVIIILLNAVIKMIVS